MKKCQNLLAASAIFAVIFLLSGCMESPTEIYESVEKPQIIEQKQDFSEVSESLEIPPEKCSHSYIISHTDEPLCEKNGKIVYLCENCGEFFSEEIPAKNHDFTEEITLEATDFSQGIKTYNCINCEKSYREYYSLGHIVSLGNGETAVVYGYWDLQAAREIFEILNKYRRENNLREFAQTDELSETARLRALECAQFYSHTRPDGSRCFTAFPKGYALAAENVGAGFGGSAQRVMEAWINSPVHNENLLNPELNFVGTSLFIMTEQDRQKHGGTYFSQEFICV